MAKIYISYSHQDIKLVHRITGELKKNGHELVMDSEVMRVGQDFRKTLLTALKSADGVLVLITENSIKSNYVVSELGSARAFVEETAHKRFLIPVVYGAIEIPHIIQDLYCVKMDEDNFDSAVKLIEHTIATSFGRKEAVEEKEDIDRKSLESKASDYIEFAISELKKRESKNSTMGVIWYSIGFVTLIAGVLFAVSGLKNLEALIIINYWTYIVLIIKSIIIVGLLIACSKYAFELGKTFMNEALRNGDRVHAISFGKFYLQAFGERITSPEEIKDVFQNWNIDKDSSFQKLNADTYDPKFTDKLLGIVNNLTEKIKA